MRAEQETIYRAELVHRGGAFVEDTAVVVSQGRIAGFLDGEAWRERAARGAVVSDLGPVALVAGQVNVHSHSFQRGLRGLTEEVGSDGSNFWSWRDQMYELARWVDADAVEIIAAMAFLEMALRGITHVGEFHYLHHRPDGTPYEDPDELALRIGRAARTVGIRLTLLPVAYHTGAIGEPAKPEQRRFVEPDVETYLGRVKRLAHRWEGQPRRSVGMAPHSIRAVPREWMEAIAAAARAEAMAVHIHACEQKKELQASEEAYGATPVEVLHRWGVLDGGWTLIHGTHISERELEILEEFKPTVGACPTTERNLGDGFLPARKLVGRGVPISLGSDSHTVIDPFEEMRLVEYHERLQRQERNVLAAVDPRRPRSTAQVLWPMGTVQGAQCLGSDGGVLDVGRPADFIGLDLRDPSLVGATPESLLSDVVLSMSASAVRDVVVDGERVVSRGHHGQAPEILDRFQALMRRFALRAGREERR